MHHYHTQYLITYSKTVSNRKQMIMSTSIKCKAEESMEDGMGVDGVFSAKILNGLQISQSRFTPSKKQIVQQMEEGEEVELALTPIPTPQLQPHTNTKREKDRDTKIGYCQQCCKWKRWAQQQQCILLQIEQLFILKETILGERLMSLNEQLSEKERKIVEITAQLREMEDRQIEREQLINRYEKRRGKDSNLNNVQNKLNILLSGTRAKALANKQNGNPRKLDQCAITMKKAMGKIGAMGDTANTNANADRNSLLLSLENKTSIEERMAKTCSQMRGAGSGSGRNEYEQVYASSSNHELIQKYQFQNENLKTYNQVLLTKLKAKKFKDCFNA